MGQVSGKISEEKLALLNLHRGGRTLPRLLAGMSAPEARSLEYLKIIYRLGGRGDVEFLS